MTIGEAAQTAYTARSVIIEEKARALPFTMPLTYRKTMHYGKIAYRAAKAEKFDPVPGPAPCGVCHGARVCDIDAHRVMA